MISVYDLFYEAVETVGCRDDLGGEIFQTTKHTIDTISGEFEIYEDFNTSEYTKYKKLFYIRDTRVFPPIPARTTSLAAYTICLPHQDESPEMFKALEHIRDEMNRKLAIYRLVSL